MPRLNTLKSSEPGNTVKTTKRYAISGRVNVGRYDSFPLHKSLLLIRTRWKETISHVSTLNELKSKFLHTGDDSPCNNGLRSVFWKVYYELRFYRYQPC